MNKQISINEAIQMNRHERRKLGAINKIKIPSIINLKKVQAKNDSVEESNLKIENK